MQNFSSAEVKELGAQRSLIIIHGKVYNVSGYLDEHPGGRDLLLDVIGTDATEHFVQAGHSDEAQDTLASFVVGSVKDYQYKVPEEKNSALYQMDNGPTASSQVWPRLAMAVPGVAFLALFLRLVVRHGDVGGTWIRLPSVSMSFFALDTPSTLLVFLIVALLVLLGGFTYWVSTIIHVEFGYGNYPEVIPASN
ncbi:hypothetical protein ABHI18_000190 [Aspergillus niger]